MELYETDTALYVWSIIIAVPIALTMITRYLGGIIENVRSRS